MRTSCFWFLLVCLPSISTLSCKTVKSRNKKSKAFPNFYTSISDSALAFLWFLVSWRCNKWISAGPEEVPAGSQTGTELLSHITTNVQTLAPALRVGRHVAQREPGKRQPPSNRENRQMEPVTQPGGQMWPDEKSK